VRDHFKRLRYGVCIAGPTPRTRGPRDLGALLVDKRRNTPAHAGITLSDLQCDQADGPFFLTCSELRTEFRPSPLTGLSGSEGPGGGGTPVGSVGQTFRPLCPSVPRQG
jgi:hypothetical protein